MANEHNFFLIRFPKIEIDSSDFFYSVHLRFVWEKQRADDEEKEEEEEE